MKDNNREEKRQKCGKKHSCSSWKNDKTRNVSRKQIKWKLFLNVCKNRRKIITTELDLLSELCRDLNGQEVRLSAVENFVSNIEQTISIKISAVKESIAYINKKHKNEVQQLMKEMCIRDRCRTSRRAWPWSWVVLTNCVVCNSFGKANLTTFIHI